MAFRATKEMVQQFVFQANPLPEDWTPMLAGPTRQVDTKEVQLYGTGAAQPFVKWAGPREVSRGHDRAQACRSETYAWAAEVTREEELYGQAAAFGLRVQDEWRTADGMFWEQNLTLLLADGADAVKGLCYDGKPYYATNHAEGASGTQSNIIDDGADPDVLTPALAANAVWAALRRFSSFKTNRGTPYPYSGPVLVMVAPKLLQPFAQAVSDTLLPDASTKTTERPLASAPRTVIVRENRWLPAALDNTALMFIADGRSLYRQEKGPIELTEKDERHDNLRVEFGAMIDRGMTFGAWQTAIKYNFTG